MTQAWVAGLGDTPFGHLEGSDTLGLMAQAAQAALDDGRVERAAVDGLVTGYSTAMPHLMLATLFAEHFGIMPEYCHAIQLGGATGAAALMLGKLLIESGQCRTVLVVAGENRSSHAGGRDAAIRTLAQVGHAGCEVPYGATIPGYYALLATHYLERHGLGPEDLAELAVLMRSHAAAHPGAQFRTPIDVAAVMASKPIATPLKLLDCCPISDGGIAVLLTAERGLSKHIRIAGAGQAHRHQHVSVADFEQFGARDAAARALRESGLGRGDVGVAGVYDSFTITLAILLEEIGFSRPGRAAADARDGRFGREGALPLNTHGGLLSFGHSGVAGGMAHFVETVRQMAGEAGARQIPSQPPVGFVHGDGGVLSSHVSLLLRQD